MDFTGILSVFDDVAIVVVISAIAAIKILPGVVRWGFSQVITWFSVGGAVNTSVAVSVSDLAQEKQSEVKKRSGGVRFSSVHPIDPPILPVSSPVTVQSSSTILPTVESNLSPESRFKIFGAIFGFFSGFFARFFSFFKKR